MIEYDAAKVVLLPGDNENEPRKIFRYCNLLNQYLLFHHPHDLSGQLELHQRYRDVQPHRVEDAYIPQPRIFLSHRYPDPADQGWLSLAEVPYRPGTRQDGKSKAVSFPSLMKVIRGYIHLVKTNCFQTPFERKFPEGTQTQIRWNGQ